DRAAGRAVRVPADAARGRAGASRRLGPGSLREGRRRRAPGRPAGPGALARHARPGPDVAARPPRQARHPELLGDVVSPLRARDAFAGSAVAALPGARAAGPRRLGGPRLAPRAARALRAQSEAHLPDPAGS